MDALQAEFARLCARQDALQQAAEDGVVALAAALRRAAALAAAADDSLDAVAGIDASPPPRPSDSIRAAVAEITGAHEAAIDAELRVVLAALPGEAQHDGSSPQHELQQLPLLSGMSRTTPRRRPRPQQQSGEHSEAAQPDEQRLRRDLPEPASEQAQAEQSTPLPPPPLRSRPSPSPPGEPMDGVELAPLPHAMPLMPAGPASQQQRNPGNDPAPHPSPPATLSAPVPPEQETAPLANFSAAILALVEPSARPMGIINIEEPHLSAVVTWGGIAAPRPSMPAPSMVRRHSSNTAADNLDIAGVTLASSPLAELSSGETGTPRLGSEGQRNGADSVAAVTGDHLAALPTSGTEQHHEHAHEETDSGPRSLPNTTGSPPVQMEPADDEPSMGDSVRATARTLNETLTADWKEVGSSHVRMAKLVDESSGADLSSMIVPGVTLDRNIVNKAVSVHLYRSALFDIAREFSEVAHVEVVVDDVRPFGALHSLLSALRNNNLKPAIDWAVENRSNLADCGQYEHLPQCLDATNTVADLDAPTTVADPESLTLTATTSSSSSSSPNASPQALDVTNSPSSSSVSRLEFSLHRLGYLDLLKNGKREDALRYARRYLVDFVDDFLLEVQELMACLLFAPDIGKSPYADLVTPSRQQDLERMLSAEYCRVMDLTVESPLLSVVRCGARALPVLLKASVISSNWKELRVGDVLPVEIELRRDYQFHTVFTCPVSREEAIDDGSKPMMLPCGHVLSKQSISRMPRGHQRFKCPYCPREQVQSECKPIQF